MALLAAVEVIRSGIRADGGAAATASDTFVNTGRELLVIENGDASSKTITIDYVPTADGLAVTDPTIVVPAGQVFVAGPWPTSLYNSSAGVVTVTYSATTSVTVKVIRVGTLG